MFSQFVLQAGPNCGVRSGELDGVHGGADVEPRTAGEDRHFAARGDVVDCGPSVRLEPGDRGFLGNIHDVEQVVRDTALLGD